MLNLAAMGPLAASLLKNNAGGKPGLFDGFKDPAKQAKFLDEIKGLVNTELSSEGAPPMQLVQPAPIQRPPVGQLSLSPGISLSGMPRTGLGMLSQRDQRFLRRF